ncbi:hypothetical protein DESC_690018 [Desulfosarcina cetonica]|nr:hypothetical protein DESC_690018 [Desulfosarcina cetonica]
MTFDIWPLTLNYFYLLQIQGTIIDGAGAGLLRLDEKRQIRCLSSQQGGAHGIGRHRIGADDQGAGGFEVGQRPARGTVGEHGFDAVQDHDRGTDHDGQFTDQRVDVLVEDIASPAQKAVPVFKGHGGTAAVVVLDRRQADDPIRVQKGGQQHRPVLDQAAALDAEAREKRIPGDDHLGTGLAGRRIDATERKAGGRIVDGVVRDGHPGRAGLFAKTHHRRHQIGVGGGAQGRRTGKGGIDLQQHPFTGFDKGLHAAQGGKGLPHGSGPVRCPGNAKPVFHRGEAIVGKPDRRAAAHIHRRRLAIVKQKRQCAGSGHGEPRPGAAADEFATIHGGFTHYRFQGVSRNVFAVPSGPSGDHSEGRDSGSR